MQQNHVLGRGKIYFDRFAPNTETPLGIERYLGNTPEFSLSVETQELDHYSAEEGLRIKDLSVTVQIDMMGMLVTDNIDLDNIAMFFFGDKATETVAPITAAEDVIPMVHQGGFIQLGRTAQNPVGMRQVSNVSVEDGTGTTYTAGTDYVLDPEMGRIEIVKGGGVADASTVTYDVAGHKHDLVISGTNIIYGSLRFLAFNGTGKNTDFFMPKVALRPNGEYALKGEEWQRFGFNMEILRSGSMERVYADGRPYDIL